MFGINLYNNSGELLVSSNYKTPHYLGSYTCSQAATWSIPPYDLNYLFSCTVQSLGKPLVFIKIPERTLAPTSYGAYSLVGLRSLGNNLWEVEVVSAGSTAPAAPIVYIFGFEPIGAYGLKTFSSGGQPVFDVSKRYLKISGAFSGYASKTTYGAEGNKTYSAPTLIFGSEPYNAAVFCGYNHVAGSARAYDPVSNGPLSGYRGFSRYRNYDTNVSSPAGAVAYDATANGYPANTNWLDVIPRGLFINTDEYQ